MLQTFFVFCSFCFAASSIYCLNDIRDVENDRKHKTKCKRPIASGAISVKNAVIIMIVLLFLSIFTLFFSKNAVKCAVIILIYYIMNVLYCFGLKNIAILDVILLSFGYVLRLIGGSFAGNIPLSEWIVIMTFLLSMFLALAKRKDDVLIMQKAKNGHSASKKHCTLFTRFYKPDSYAYYSHYDFLLHNVHSSK